MSGAPVKESARGAVHDSRLAYALHAFHAFTLAG